MTATEELRRLLDERGVEHQDATPDILRGATNWVTKAWLDDGRWFVAIETQKHDFTIELYGYTSAQAIDATLGREPWVNPTWERWHKSLKHDEIKSIGDAVEQLMYEAIEFGGDMGPNGNTYNGIDEGDVLTSGFINEWIAWFESTLGRNRYSYGQYREIANAVGDAMEYAHDRAIEHPDAADPLWNLDEYVNRILKVAFEGEATLGRGECRNDSLKRGAGVFVCSECGAYLDIADMDEEDMDVFYEPSFCPSCGKKVVDE